MRHALFFTAAVAAATWSLAGLSEQRQLGPHQHGHGRLNIAIEDKTVSMELEVPGADIVGFEREPATADEKAVLDKAKATLADGLSLFEPPSEAGCTLKHATLTTEDGHEEEHEGHPASQEEGHGQDHHHSEFHVAYEFECRSPARFTSLTFNYFKSFPRAEQLDVSLITTKGQTSFKVDRDTPSTRFEGVM